MQIYTVFKIFFFGGGAKVKNKDVDNLNISLNWCSYHLTLPFSKTLVNWWEEFNDVYCAPGRENKLRGATAISPEH